MANVREAWRNPNVIVAVGLVTATGFVAWLAMHGSDEQAPRQTVTISKGAKLYVDDGKALPCDRLKEAAHDVPVLDRTANMVGVLITGPGMPGVGSECWQFRTTEGTVWVDVNNTSPDLPPHPAPLPATPQN